eukprot:TRINITY_DN127_c1_g1_i1.p1 TRINITY_DN127_c1_g1~~TRINITY_DN127_c1_g1_i1.p1  ORF type:complete len:366 (-),score=144.90 TRINITY_DN127_c1_g1_i1:109-1143(-)
MEEGQGKWWMGVGMTVGLSVMTAVGGYKARALDRGGAVAGAVVGLLTGLAGTSSLSTLFAFFVSSSLLTRVKAQRKRQVEEGYRKGGQRTALQVMSNGLMGALSSLALSLSSPSPLFSSSDLPLWRGVEAFWVGALLGHYGCCNGDTWASELGVAFGSPRPLLLLGLRRLPSSSPSSSSGKDKAKAKKGGWKVVVGERVAAGTNGGMSGVGTVSSLMGGLFVGFGFLLPSLLSLFPFPLSSFLSFSPLALSSSLWILFLSALSGFLGSLIDSVMGALLQESVWDKETKKVKGERLSKEEKEKEGERFEHITGLPLLDNHQVNLLSSILTALLVGYVSFIFSPSS